MRYTKSMEATREDLAYIAGLVDGEGSITIGRRGQRPDNGGHSPQHNLVVSVVNTHLPTLQWLQETIGAGAIHYKPRNGSLGTKDCYVWKLGGNQQAHDFLTAVRPWLRMKADQCWLGLEFLAQRTSFLTAGRGHYLSGEELALREGFYLAMRSANA